MSKLSMNSKISLCLSPQEFFFDLIEEAVNKHDISISDFAKFYLVKMLTDNVNPENLLKKNDENPFAETPLAIVLHKALNKDRVEQKRMLKFIGDYSLYIAGFFGESLNKKIIDVDYYIEIGGHAYNNLSSITLKKAPQLLYQELHNKFPELISILTEVSFVTCTTTAKDIIRLYDRWIKTGNTAIEDKLLEKGIVLSGKKLKIA